MISGGCACGAVKYEVLGEFEDFCHCHCSVCRKLHGAAFVSWGKLPPRQFRFLCGEEQIVAYAFSQRADSLSCRRCASTLLVDYRRGSSMYYLALGALDTAVALPPGFHQFVASKAAWYEIEDKLPCFAEWPPGKA